MRYLITGYTGQLGYDIKQELLKINVSEENILALGSEDMDITDKIAVDKIIEKFNPDVIFHCAAWTKVDKAEEEEALVKEVNVMGTKNIVDAAIKSNAKVIYISTDYVFDGTKDGLYEVNDIANPKSVYGLTKYQGEEEVRKIANHFIARVSWVFGINGNNFIKTMLKLSETHDELNVVDDQIGSPTYTVDLAKILVLMSETEKYGTYHITNEGFCSWADFAEYIFKASGRKVKVNHVSTEEYLKITNTKQAYRPRNSKLDKSKLLENGFNLLPTWQNATDRYLDELENNKVLIRK